eukprot:5001703-Karenia_brevis.AAC.1
MCTNCVAWTVNGSKDKAAVTRIGPQHERGKATLALTPARGHFSAVLFLSAPADKARVLP